ncbi:MAG: hypothetical protein J4F43_05470 [Dehalococcoidia bacterium]|nr:hypothetical protein [Dehalococcoidia bacterium]
MKAAPESIIGEVLGEPAARQRSPATAGYLCPFINSECTKRGHRRKGPYPVCSVWHSVKSPRLMATCPQRFYQVDVVADVVAHCWPGPPPKNPRFAPEVSMDKFGTVDLVVADLDDEARQIKEFVSVELQAVDLGGTVQPAYSALLNHELIVETTYGVNWANVRKRYMDQLVAKSFYHNRWGTRIVAVMQTPLYDYLQRHIKFDELATGPGTVVDVFFLLYDFVEGTGPDETHTLVFDRVVGTSHSSLMTHTLYQNPPTKKVFAARILERLQ